MSKTMSSLKPERMKMVDSNSMTPPCHDINNNNLNRHNHHNDGKIIRTAVSLRIPHKSSSMNNAMNTINNTIHTNDPAVPFSLSPNNSTMTEPESKN